MQVISTLNPVQEFLPQTTPRVLTRFVTLCLLLAIIPTFAVYGIRIHSLLERGALTTTTGYEGPMIYGVWKAAHHLPIYESVARPLFSNTLYNYLFYKSYGFLNSGLSPDDPRALLISRLATCLFAALGAAFCFVSARGLVGSRASEQTLQAFLAAALFWFSSSPVGWFGISVRPDIGAVAMAALGLLFLLSYLRNLNEAMVVCSSFAFFLAWSFKQNVVLTFVGAVLIHCVVIRRWRPILLQVFPFACCVISTLYFGGADYRFNTLVVPSLGVFTPFFAWTFPLKAITENPLLYCTVPLALICLASQKCITGSIFKAFNISSANDQVVAFVILFAVTFLGGFAFCFRAGADRNYFFEAGMVAAVGLLPSLRSLFHHWPRFAKVWVLVGLCTVAAVCSIQVFSFMKQASQPTGTVSKLPVLGNSELGRLSLLSETQAEERLKLFRFVSSQRKPILITDDIFCEPFYSTGGQFPALVQDSNINGDLLRHGIIKTDPVASAIRQHLFPTLLIQDPDQVALAVREGYIGSGNVDGYFKAYSLLR